MSPLSTALICRIRGCLGDNGFYTFITTKHNCIQYVLHLPPYSNLGNGEPARDHIDLLMQMTRNGAIILVDAAWICIYILVKSCSFVPRKRLCNGQARTTPGEASRKVLLAAVINLLRAESPGESSLYHCYRIVFVLFIYAYHFELPKAALCMTEASYHARDHYENC